MKTRSHLLPRIVILLALLVLALWLGGCAPYQTRVDFDPAARLAELKTYAWVPADKSVAAGDSYQSLDQVRLRRAFEDALAAKGLQPVAEAEAQVWVDLNYEIKRRYEAQTVYYGYYGWHPYWWGMEPDTRIDERDESRLSLIMISPQSRAVIWTGQATVRYYDDYPPKERNTRLVEQVQAVMEQFPPH